MIDVRTEIDIARPAAEVFAYVSDQTNAPHWQEGLHEVRRTTQGPIGVGSQHVFIRVFAGRRIESWNRFVTYDPTGLFVEFEVPDGPMTGVASYRIEPTGVDTCRLTGAVRFRASGIMRLATPLLSYVMKRDTARDDRRLKTLLEGRNRTHST